MSKNTELDPLAALAATDPTALTRKACLVVRTLDLLDEAQARTLRFLVDESGHSAPRIAKAAQEAGIHLADDTIQKHRRRDCPCPA